MLTKVFWAEAEARNFQRFDIFGVKGKNWDDTYAAIVPCASHCGTLELRDIDEDTNQSGRLTNVVGLICEGVRDDIGHFLYYAPKSRNFTHATKLLRRVGFKKVSEFIHHGYTERSPDFGRAQMWELSLTKDEFDLLKEGVHNGVIS